MRSMKICIVAGLLAATAVGCGSDSASCGDAGCPDAAVGDGGDGGQVLYGLSAGDSCFAITAIAANPTDGCDLGVASLATMMASLPVTYTAATGSVAVGTMGALGAGAIRNNAGTLLRENDPSDVSMPTCTWHQKNTSQVQLLANNKFTIQVSWVQTMFAPACTMIPTGGTCTSTWTWTMEKSAKLPPGCQ